MIIPKPGRIYLAKGATDLRKSTYALSSIVKASFDLNPYDKNMYVFCNRDQNKIKILQYDKNGFWLYYKVLEQGRFAWPKETDGVMELTEEESNWLLHGLSLVDKQRSSMPIYKYSY